MAQRADQDGRPGADEGGAQWVRLGRGVLRYSIVYAGAPVVATVLLLGSDLALVGLVGLGCVLLLLAAGGDRGRRTMFPGSHADRLFEAGTVEAEARPGAAVSRTAKYVLVGVGLIDGGIVALSLT